jgi:hypothetical protein
MTSPVLEETQYRCAFTPQHQYNAGPTEVGDSDNPPSQCHENVCLGGGGGKVQFQLSVIHFSTFLPRQPFVKPSSKSFLFFFCLILSQSSRALQTPLLLTLLAPCLAQRSNTIKKGENGREEDSLGEETAAQSPLHIASSPTSQTRSIPLQEAVY